MTLLDDRLAVAGDQLDDLIDTRIERCQHLGAGVGARRAPSHRRALAVAAVSVACVAGGLLWLSARSGPADATVADEGGPTASIPSSIPSSTVSPAIEPVDDVDDVATAPVSPSTPTSPTTLPIADRPPLAIGESVMLGAAPQLQAGGFVVNADEARQGEDTASVVGQLRTSGQIGEVVVLQVGTNGPVAAETYDEIMSFLPAEEVEQVIFLTVAAPRGWIEPNNALIWALQTRYSNVQVLDWAGFVASGQVPGLAGDGIHLGTAAAKQFYANYIFDVAGRRDLVQPLPE